MTEEAIKLNVCCCPLRALPCWLIIAGLLLLPGGRPARAELVDRIVAVVNEDIITLFELNEALKAYSRKLDQLPSEEARRQAFFELRRELLNELISEKLTEQEIQRSGISVSEEEIDAYIARIKQSRYLTDEDLRRRLAAEGMSMADYRAELRRQLQRTKLVNREVKSKVVVTQEDVAAYYQQHAERYRGSKEYHLWNLFVRLAEGADQQARESARRLLAQALERLSAGADFEAVVAEVNRQAQGIEGSDLGRFTLDELAEELRKVVAELAPGQHSGILETGFGLQVVYLEEVIEQPSKSLEEVTPEIQDELYRQIVDQRFRAWLEELRKRSHIKLIN